MDLRHVKRYYKRARQAFGDTAKGVDWNHDDAQIKRFEALALVIQEPNAAVNDWGCGYGEFYYYADTWDYCGFDIVIAQFQHGGKFMISDHPTRIADYTVASGLFNVKLNAGKKDWLAYVHNCIGVMNEKSRKGFAFNMLPHCDDERESLYYANPYRMLEHCRKYGRVSLLQHYLPYDFTILVNK